MKGCEKHKEIPQRGCVECGKANCEDSRPAPCSPRCDSCGGENDGAVCIVLQVCNEWRHAGMGDECFWEDWGDCPSEVSLTPNMVFDAISKPND